MTELPHLLELCTRSSFHHQLHQQTEGHFLAVEEPMRRWQLGQAVVHRVGDGQPAGFESESGQQGVGLGDPFQGRGHGACVHGSCGCGSVGVEGAAAQFG